MSIERTLHPHEEVCGEHLSRAFGREAVPTLVAAPVGLEFQC